MYILHLKQFYQIKPQLSKQYFSYSLFLEQFSIRKTFFFGDIFFKVIRKLKNVTSLREKGILDKLTQSLWIIYLFTEWCRFFLNK